ncbi:TPA: hypothetical protein ACP5VM_003367 [Vibrio parahaemolyticus]|uniref:hypothetical protein n=2 Tax=Vibrio TaxID=662 RepID=UPI000418A02E|nr:hypothetical protein [Vibrio parahaemolyticus]TOL24349.1 hypothetical protein CGI02_14610 [Vibrio parahaemolyticus]
MNLIHGFCSTNPLINPDVVLMQRGTYAHQLKRLFTDSKLRVGHLYEMKTTASSSVKFWDSLSAYFDEITYKAKESYTEIDSQYQFLTYLADAVYLIEKKGIDWDVTIQSLILDDDQTQETHDQQLRNISHLLKMTKQYAEQF